MWYCRVAALNNEYRLNRQPDPTSSIVNTSSFLPKPPQSQPRDGYEVFEAGEAPTYVESEAPAHDISKYSKWNLLILVSL